MHVNERSHIAEQGLKFYTVLYDVERDAVGLAPEQRLEIRRARAKPVADALHTWLVDQRRLVPEGSAIAKALDYNLKRWDAVIRYLDDGRLPIDNTPRTSAPRRAVGQDHP